MNREDIPVGQLLSSVLTAIRRKDYNSAVEPLLRLRRFVIEQPLQVTEGEKLAIQNMEDCVSAGLVVEHELSLKCCCGVNKNTVGCCNVGAR